MTFVSQKQMYVLCGVLAMWCVTLTCAVLFLSNRMFITEDAFGGLGGLRTQTTVLETGNQPSVSPTRNNFFDNGSPTSSWKNVYVSSTIYTPITGATTTPFKIGQGCIPMLNSDGAQRYLFINGTTWTVSTTNCGSI